MQVWEVIYRAGNVRYVRFHEYLAIQWATTIEPILVLLAVAIFLFVAWRGRSREQETGTGVDERD